MKQFIGLMKDKSGGKIISKFAALRPETSSYLSDDKDENKKAKGTKKCVKKQKVKFDNCKKQQANQLEKKII